MSSPYRDAAVRPRFLCIVCYRSLSEYAGPCRTCGVPRLDLDEPEVREQVRAEAEKRLQRRMYREYSLLSMSSAALVAPTMWWLGGLAFALVPPVALVMARFWRAVRRDSAIATYAARRRKLSTELGVDVRVLDDPARRRERERERDRERAQERERQERRVLGGASPAALAKRSIGSDETAPLGTPAIDPADLDLEELLRWLGATLDDAPRPR